MADKKLVRRLILIYDADAGAMSALVDSARKLFKLNGCALCSITHGLAGEKSEWKTCRAEIGVPVDHLHRGEVFSPLRQVVAGCPAKRCTSFKTGCCPAKARSSGVQHRGVSHGIASDAVLMLSLQLSSSVQKAMRPMIGLSVDASL